MFCCFSWNLPPPSDYFSIWWIAPIKIYRQSNCSFNRALFPVLEKFGLHLKSSLGRSEGAGLLQVFENTENRDSPGVEGCAGPWEPHAAVGQPQCHPHIPGAPGAAFQPAFGVGGHSQPGHFPANRSSSGALWLPRGLMNAWVWWCPLCIPGTLQVRETSSLAGFLCCLCLQNGGVWGADLPCAVGLSPPAGRAPFPAPALPSLLFSAQPCSSPGATSQPDLAWSPQQQLLIHLWSV